MVQQYLDDLKIILPGHSNIICSLNSSKVGYQIKVYIRPKNERSYKERTRWRACTPSRQRLYRVPPKTSGGGGVACPNWSAVRGGCQGRGPMSAGTLCTHGGVGSWLRHWLESECGPSPSPYRNDFVPSLDSMAADPFGVDAITFFISGPPLFLCDSNS